MVKEFNFKEKVRKECYPFHKRPIELFDEFIKRKNDLNEEIVRAYLDTYLCKDKKFRLLRDGILGEMKEKGNKLAGNI